MQNDNNDDEFMWNILIYFVILFVFALKLMNSILMNFGFFLNFYPFIRQQSVNQTSSDSFFKNVWCNCRVSLRNCLHSIAFEFVRYKNEKHNNDQSIHFT